MHCSITINNSAAVPPTSGPDLTPPDVESHCSHVNWLNSPSVSCGDISGYVLRLFNPDTNETVERRVGTREHFTTFCPQTKIFLGKSPPQFRYNVSLCAPGLASDFNRCGD